MGIKLEVYTAINSVNEDIDISSVEIDTPESYDCWRNVFWGLKELGSGLIKGWHVKVITDTDKAMGY